MNKIFRFSKVFYLFETYVLFFFCRKDIGSRNLSEDVVKNFQVLLKNEVVSLKECGRLTDLLKTAVMNRDSQSLKTLLSRLSEESDRLKMIEERRVEGYSRLCRCFSVSEKTSFYDLISVLPSEESSILTVLYRELKREVVLYQGRLKNLDDYVYSVTGTVNSVLETYTNRNTGGVYNQSGRFTAPSEAGRSVFISTEL